MLDTLVHAKLSNYFACVITRARFHRRYTVRHSLSRGSHISVMKTTCAAILFLTSSITLTRVATAAPRQAQIVCSEDVIPGEMVVTATGTSPVCHGSCRARRIEPVRGPVMIICANQPVPKDYSLDSVTTTPDCRCLSNEDNAYVIKRTEASEAPDEEELLQRPSATSTMRSTVSPWEPIPDFRTGD